MYTKDNNSKNKFLMIRDDLYCKYCGRKCKNLNSLKQHELRCKLNPDRRNYQPSTAAFEKAHESLKGHTPWNKGLTQESDARVAAGTEKMKRYWDTHDGTFLNKHHTEATKKRISDFARDNNFQSHWGTRKSYEYAGYKFISSYEITLAKDLDLNNIKWIKPTYGTFKYIDKTGKVHTYTPDFYLPEYDLYLDPKNDYLINNVNPTFGYSDCDKIRWVQEQNNVKILILNKHQLNWSSIQNLI